MSTIQKLEVRLTKSSRIERLVGTLAQARGRIYFEYAPEFLATGHSLSPFKLPFAPGLFEHGDRRFGPLPGLFDDSLPDGWGLLLMDRHFGRLGRSQAEIGPLERLAFLGRHTMGALTYHAPAGQTPSREPDESLLALGDLARNSLEILAGEAAEVLPRLLRAGSSPGGARPKVLVGWAPSSDRIVTGEAELPQGYEPWLVKFPSRRDEPHAGAVELAYASMAGAAGIEMAKTRLFETTEGDRFFGTRRFDREGDERIHVHTLGNLIHADFRIPSSDYADLLKVTARLTRHSGHVLGAFRRAVFNVLAHNRDDHVKNFAFLLDDSTGLWSLSPAYDLTESAGPGGEHSMTIAGEGRDPGLQDLERLAAKAGIARRDALAIVEEVRSVVSRWQEFADEAEVPRGVARRIGGLLRV
ncbi:MAG: type II toxin-antitoxin system HipA family toxin [Polyangia bacterium]|jgi:serine/threonine-protein kinase HipA|nr:type II toxin-antitoxin system HipA family toxin [Polyangia bacterium]